MYMQAAKKFLIEKGAARSILFLAWAICTLVLCINHEPWRDEAQSWLIARDSDLAGLFTILKSEVSPGLWYFIIMPFAKIGVPYAAQTYINWFIMLVGMAVLVYLSPLPVWAMAVLAVSHPFFYVYPVMARTYALGVTTSFIVCALYGYRKQFPVWYAVALACMMNSTLFLIPPAGVLMIGFAWEAHNFQRLRWVLPVLGVGILLAYAAAYPGSMKPYSDSAKHAVNSDYGLLVIGAKVLKHRLENKGVHVLLSAVAVVLLLGAAQRSLLVVMTLLSVVAGLHFVCNIWLPVCAIRHFSVLTLIFFCCVWIANSQGKLPQYHQDTDKIRGRMLLAALVAMCASLLVEAYNNIPGMSFDFKYSWSASKEAAEYIDTLPKDAEFAVYPTPYGSAILSYLPDRQFWYPERDMYGTFTDWKKSKVIRSEISDNCLIEVVRRHFDPSKKVYLITSEKFDQADSSLYKEQKYIWGGMESYAVSELLVTGKPPLCTEPKYLEMMRY